MQCDEFQTRLNAVLDERRDPALDSQLSKHVQACPLCRETLQVGSQLANLWSTPNETSARPRSAPFNPRVFLGMFAVASALLLMLSCGWDTATSLQITDLTSTPPTSIESASGHQTDERTDLADFAESPAREAAFVHQPLLSLGLLSTAADWHYRLEEVPAPFAATLSDIEPRWRDAVSGGMAPVQESVSKTLAAIARSLSS